jgi:hypothetical protein
MSGTADTPFLFQFSYQGEPLVGGKLFTYQGGTTTKQVTYTDSSLSVPCANPIILDSNGVAQYWTDNNLTYKFVLALPTDSDPPTSPLYSTDNISAVILSPFYAQTITEQFLGITPTSFLFPEGWITRYGANTATADNSFAFNDALQVSGAGGSAAYIPAGTWNIQTAIPVAAGSSMYGAGKSSILQSVGCDALVFQADNGIVPTARFFRDFQILGTLTGGTNSNKGINITWPVGNVVSGVTFQNIAIQHFQYGAFLQGLEYCQFDHLWMYDVFNGFYFNGQSVNVDLVSCVAQRGAITGSGNSQGLSFNVTVGVPDVEGIHVYGGSLYNFAYNIFSELAFEVQIEHMDISAATIAGIFVSSTIGGFVVRDCWIETTNGAATFGIQAPNITPAEVDRLVFEGNYINCDTPFAGSTGIQIGNARNGVRVHSNQIIGFDLGVTLGNSSFASIKHNTIDCNTSVYSATSAAITVNSLTPNVDIGPNYIVPGASVAATMSNSSANITVPAASAFPIGTPVQVDATQNGFTIGVTYYVIASSGTTITIGPYGGSAISATGGTAVNLFVQPDPVDFNTTTTPPKFSLTASGASVIVLSDPALSVIADWNANGKMVSLSPRASSTGSAGNTSLSIIGIAIYLFPHVQSSCIPAIENNSAISYGYGSVAVGGTFTVFPTPAAGAWTNSGTKGLLGGSMLWPY